MHQSNKHISSSWLKILQRALESFLVVWAALVATLWFLRATRNAVKLPFRHTPRRSQGLNFQIILGSWFSGTSWKMLCPVPPENTLLEDFFPKKSCVWSVLSSIPSNSRFLSLARVSQPYTYFPRSNGVNAAIERTSDFHSVLPVLLLVFIISRSHDAEDAAPFPLTTPNTKHPFLVVSF